MIFSDNTNKMIRKSLSRSLFGLSIIHVVQFTRLFFRLNWIHLIYVVYVNKLSSLKRQMTAVYVAEKVIASHDCYLFCHTILDLTSDQKAKAKLSVEEVLLTGRRIIHQSLKNNK